MEDLIQVATVGLIKSVDRFDPGREIAFMAFATPTILGELKRHFRDKGWAMSVSRSMQELYLDIGQAQADLTQRLRRTPQIADIAEHLGVSAAQVARGLECAQAYRPRSLSAPVADSDDTAMSEILGAPDPRLESVADRATLRELLIEVTQRERDILAMRFFENLTQAEIAERVGMSQMHVSRLLTRTLTDLRHKMLVDD